MSLPEKKSKIKRWLVAAGIGIVFTAGMTTSTGRESLEKSLERKEAIVHKSSVEANLRKVATKKAHAGTLEKPKESNDNLFAIAENMCLESETNILLAARIMGAHKDYENAEALCEDDEDYICAAEMATKRGDLDLAKGYLLTAREKHEEDDDWIAYSIASKFKEIGEYSLAMQTYEERGMKAPMVRLALEYGDEATASSVFDDIAANTVSILYEKFAWVKRFGYLDAYKEACLAAENKACLSEIITDEGNPEKMIEWCLKEKSVTKAMVLAKKYGITLPSLDEALEEEIKFALNNEAAGIIMGDFVKLGRGEELLNRLEDENYSYMGDILNLEEALGKTDKIFEFYENESPFPGYLNAANYANKWGMEEKEAEYLKRYLDYKKVNINDLSTVDITEAFSIAGALARLGYLQKALDVCGMIKEEGDISVQCNCAAQVIEILEPEAMEPYTGL